MAEITEAEAAIFLRRGDPVQPKRAHFRPQIAGKAVVAVDLGGARRNLIVGKLARRLTDRVRVFAEVKIERGGAVGDHGGRLAPRVSVSRLNQTYAGMASDLRNERQRRK